MKILNSKIVKWFFYKYFGIPKDKEIFKLQKNAIHYWENEKEAKCRVYQFNLWDIPIVKKLKYICLIGLAFLKIPLAFILDTDVTSSFSDAQILKDHPNTNYNSGEILACGVDFLSQYTKRFIVDAILSGGSGTISSIKFYLYTSYVAGSIGYNAHEVTKDVVMAEVTWNIYSTGNNWDTPGGDYSATVLDTTIVNTANTWYSWELIDSGKGWGDRLTFLVKSSTEALNKRFDAYSQEYVADPSKRPYIEITYTPAPAGRSHGYIF